ncbi:PucR family transcriptional regulator [Kutzneria sp. NPDC052558]|uniref:PucR family transcriptional regulator n=1 Tax=Kutzneria sp. NPDC052558 TaxID=3364121 RepID=UPI0037C72C26
MTPTLAALVDRPDLALRVLAGAEHLDRPVQWVHTSELADPTAFLEGGELLLTTGLWVRSGATAYVQRLHAAGVAGLGFGTGLTHAAVPTTVIKAADALGLPVIEVPRQVPFIAISKAVAKAVAAEEYAAVTRAYQAQRALTSAAVRPNGVRGVTAQLARRLKAWAVVLDPRGQVRAGDSPVLSELLRELPRLDPGPASLTFESAGVEIAVQTLGVGARVRGYLAVGRDTRLTRADQQVLTTAASLLTVGFEQSQAVETATRRLRGGLLRLLLAGETALVAEIAADLWGELPAAPVRVVLAAGPPRRLQAVLEQAGDAFHAPYQDSVLVIVEADAELSLPGLQVGVSDPAEYGSLDRALKQAQRALAAAVRADLPVTRFSELADDGVLRLVDPEVAGVFADRLLAPLVEHDATGRGELIASLRAWLAHNGQWDPAAAALGVHRHTLRHRIAKVGQLLGRDLDAADTRAELWLALRLRD